MRGDNHVISAYVPQVGLDDIIKRQFQEAMDGLMKGISNREDICRKRLK
jgi:hypothetical protein